MKNRNTMALGLAAACVVLPVCKGISQTTADNTKPSMGATMEVAMPAGSNFSTAAFRFWCPEEVKAVRGVVVLVPGSNGDGRPLAQDGFWQAFARRHEFALAGCCFRDRQHENMNIEEYALAPAGSGQALLDAIGKFAEATKHPEAAGAPLLLWGHSAGGEFNYEFSCWKPERVLAFVVNKGGYYYTHVAPAATRRTPGILFIGEKDEEFRRLSIRGIFAVNRRAGALWTLAVEPNAGHEEGGTRGLAAAFFDSIIKLRLPESGGTEAKTMMAQPLSQAWAGDLNTFDMKAAGESRPNGVVNAWLPDGEFAGVWRAFVRGETH